jgi:hypothetical protein
MKQVNVILIEDGCEWPHYIMLECEDGSMTCEVDRSS